MYPYHNKIKQRINNKELTGYEYVDKYKTISPCLLLYFSTDPMVRPIRKHRFDEYEEILKEIAKQSLSLLQNKFIEKTRFSTREHAPLFFATPSNGINPIV